MSSAAKLFLQPKDILGNGKLTFRLHRKSLVGRHGQRHVPGHWSDSLQNRFLEDVTLWRRHAAVSPKIIFLLRHSKYFVFFLHSFRPSHPPARKPRWNLSVASRAVGMWRGGPGIPTWTRQDSDLRHSIYILYTLYTAKGTLECNIVCFTIHFCKLRTLSYIVRYFFFLRGFLALSMELLSRQTRRWWIRHCGPLRGIRSSTVADSTEPRPMAQNQILHCGLLTGSILKVEYLCTRSQTRNCYRL